MIWTFIGGGAAPATLNPAAVALDLYELPGFSWTGALIRVRRSSDNVEADFYQGATAGSLNTTRGGGGTDIATWVGTGNDGYITKWYDQSGNTRDFGQTSASLQPRIVINGALNVYNSKPAIYFSGVGAAMRLTSADISFTDSTVISVFNLDNYTNINNAAGIFARTAATQFKWMALLTSETQTSEVKYQESNGSTFIASSSPVNAKTNQVLAFASRTSKLSIYADNTAPTVEDATVSPGTGFDGMAIGNFKGNSAWNYYGLQGNIQSVIFYTSDRSADRTDLQNIVNGYYGAF